MRAFLEVTGILVALVVLGFIINAIQFGSFSFWAPKFADAERKVFENTQAYNQGMVRDLENLQLQYESGTSEQKLALKATILHRFAGYNENEFPPSLRAFYSKIRNPGL